MNKIQYIEKFIKIHNNKYDYSLFKNFKNNKDKIKIICPIHGVFEQSISNHSRGGEYYIKELGYWVDGYDKKNNTVYEFDEEFHKYQTEKDKKRQKEIKKILECKFIRIIPKG